MTLKPRFSPAHRLHPALCRLAALNPLDDGGWNMLTAALGGALKAPPRRELVTEGRPVTRPLLLLEGWAARVRILQDGRRQFVSLLLPGDVIGRSGIEDALASCTVTALTAVVTCPLPQQTSSPELDRALAIGDALNEAYLVAQVTRLGRLNARERILDFVLELHERLLPTGLAGTDSFEVPLTQEVLADALGLTSVHVNRMVQQLRRSGDLEWTGQRVRIPNVDQTQRAAGRSPVKIVA